MELSFSRDSDSSRILPSLLTDWSAAVTSVIFSEKLSGVVLILTMILAAGARTKAQIPPITKAISKATPRTIHFLRESKVGIFLVVFSLFSSESCSNSLESNSSTWCTFDLFGKEELPFWAFFVSTFFAAWVSAGFEDWGASCSDSSTTSSTSLIDWSFKLGLLETGASLYSLGKTGLDWRFLAKGRPDTAASFISTGSSVTITTALSRFLAVFAINFRLIALRITLSFFGGTRAITFCFDDLRWLIISVISSSGSI